MRTTSRSAATSVFAVPTHFSTSALTDFTVSIALASGDL